MTIQARGIHRGDLCSAEHVSSTISFKCNGDRAVDKLPRSFLKRGFEGNWFVHDLPSDRVRFSASATNRVGVNRHLGNKGLTAKPPGRRTNFPERPVTDSW